MSKMYNVRLPEDAWFCQAEENGVYWISIMAVYLNNAPEFPWGWTNHAHMYNDDAVTGTFDGSNWRWRELFDQTGASEDMSFMLFTDPTQPCECMASTNPDFAEWTLVGKPDCWCYERQCRGDADGNQIGPFWVQSLDLGILISAYNKIVLPPGGICADFDHQQIGPFRVQSLDLAILITYYNKLEVLVPPCSGPGSGGDPNPLPNSEFNWWTN